MVHDHLSKTGAQRLAAALLLGQGDIRLDIGAGAFEGCHSCFKRVRLAGELIQSFLAQNDQLSEARKKEILRGIRATTALGGRRVPLHIRHSLELIT